MTIQKKATVVSTSVAALLTIIKFGIGLASGSVSVLASAVDSILDMFVSLFNYFAITKSEKPADEQFNYGRGKIEALASVIEGTIISMSGAFLLYQAILKYMDETTSTYLGTSIIVMLISTTITILLVIFLDKVAKETDNMVIKADSLHYKTDVYTNLSVLISLGLVYVFKLEIIDILVGGAISIYIIYSAYSLIKDGILVLLDKALDKEKVDMIEEILNNERDISGWHFLKTREAGGDTFVDVHLVFNCLISLMDAHKVSDRIEDKVKKLDITKNWVINIHLDPYDDSIINNASLACNLNHH